MVQSEHRDSEASVAGAQNKSMSGDGMPGGVPEVQGQERRESQGCLLKALWQSLETPDQGEKRWVLEDGH